nr:SapB/AmfS family lantipeptide [Streptomyces scabichelini]
MTIESETGQAPPPGSRASKNCFNNPSFLSRLLCF